MQLDIVSLSVLMRSVDQDVSMQGHVKAKAAIKRLVAHLRGSKPRSPAAYAHGPQPISSSEARENAHHKVIAV